jgi:hypothetical protein
MAACVVLMAGAAAEAQTADLRTSVRAELRQGDPVWVETTDGSTDAMRFSALLEDAIVLTNGGPLRTIRFDAVRRIQGRDGVANGIRNGAIAGAAAGAGFGIFLSRVFCEVDDCGDQLRRDLPAVFMLAGIGAAGGGLLGWAIDHAMDGRRIIYERRPTARMSLAPLISRDVRGLGATISWR